jgi:hypothetical protein
MLSSLSENLVRILVHGSKRIPRALPIYLPDAQLNAMKSRWKLAPFLWSQFLSRLLFHTSFLVGLPGQFTIVSPSLHSSPLFLPEAFFFPASHLFLLFIQHPLLARSRSRANLLRKPSNNLHPLPQKNILPLSSHIVIVTMRGPHRRREKC